MKTSRLLVSICLLASLIAGCAASTSGNVYSRNQTNQALTVSPGTVTAVRDVQIDGSKSGAGTAIGGVSGSVIGSTIGGTSHDRRVGAVVGGLAGALIGTGIEQGATTQAGLEITVKLDSGQTMAIVQGADTSFRAGDRVEVLHSFDGTVRVRFAN